MLFSRAVGCNKILGSDLGIRLIIGQGFGYEVRKIENYTHSAISFLNKLNKHTREISVDHRGFYWRSKLSFGYQLRIGYLHNMGYAVLHLKLYIYFLP